MLEIWQVCQKAFAMNLICHNTGKPNTKITVGRGNSIKMDNESGNLYIFGQTNIGS